jgi:hypothetical protein
VNIALPPQRILVQRPPLPIKDHVPEATEEVGHEEEGYNEGEKAEGGRIEARVLGETVKDLKQLEDAQQLTQLH